MNHQSGFTCPREQLNLTEKGLLELLDFRPLSLTPPSDIVKQVLFFSNNSQDFSPIIDKSEELIVMTLIHAEICL
jgi:hypothetical protein